MKERIQCAAVRWFNDSGGAVIVWGSKSDLSNAHHLIRDFLVDYNPVHGSKLFKFAEQGFYTSEGRFVDRREALLIATVAKQIIHKHPDYLELYSEDLRQCKAPDHSWCRYGLI